MTTDYNQFAKASPYRDGVLLSTSIFDRDAHDEDPPVLKLPAGYGDAKDALGTRRRRGLLGQFDSLDIRVPKRMTDAFAVLEAVQAVKNDTANRPDIIGADPKNVTADVTAYVDALSRRSAIATALDGVLKDAHAGIRIACRESINDGLIGIRSRFDVLAAEFAETYPGLGEFWTVGEAAEADQDGSTAVQWRKATKTAAELDVLLDLVLELHTNVKAARSSVNENHVLTLHTDPESFDQTEYHRLLSEKNFRNGTFEKHRPYPFGLYGLALDAGAELTLPGNYEEWTQRADYFLDVKGDALRGLYFTGDRDAEDEDDEIEAAPKPRAVVTRGNRVTDVL